MDDELIERTDTIYRHVKRTEWGHAIVAWEGDDRRLYQFEDGKARTIHHQFDNLLQPVDKPRDRTLEIVRNLKAMLRASGTWSGKDAPEVSLEELMTLDEQCAMFRVLFPDAFDDDEYIAQHRGGEGRHLKRHRDGAIAAASDELSTTALHGATPSDVFQAFVRVAKTTDLVPARDQRDLGSVKAPKQAVVGEALVELLYGEGAFTDRFTNWTTALRAALGRNAGWEIATFVCALMFPQEHVCVKQTAFRDQAKWMAPSLRFRTRTEARLYERLRRMANEVREHLVGAGLPPKDLLDVYNFMWATQRPAAKELLAQVRAERSAARPGVADAAE